MREISVSEWLFYGGLAGMGAAVILGIAALIVLFIRGQQIKIQLEKEYGKKLL